MDNKQEIEILVKTLSSNSYIIEFFDKVVSDSVLLENLFKIEQSAKVTENKILSDRFVLQFKKSKNFTLIKILNFFNYYNFPTDKISIAKEYFNRIDCDVVLFGIETDNEKIRCKLYFEYFDKQKILGIKWNNSKSSITYYDQTLKISYTEIIKKSNFNILPKFILDKSSHIIGIYNIVDEHTGKNAFSIIFEPGSMYLKDLSNDVLSITKEDINCISHLKWFDMRHFTGGIEKNNKYFNIYFVVYWKR
jgi:hypothetical protein